MDIAVYIGIIGALAFMVSLITEATKNLGFLKRIPTDLQVIVLGVGLCLLALYGYASYSGLTVVWYMVAGAILGGFIVAYVAMYGWSKLKELWTRFKSGDADVIDNFGTLIKAPDDPATAVTDEEAKVGGTA